MNKKMILLPLALFALNLPVGEGISLTKEKKAASVESQWTPSVLLDTLRNGFSVETTYNEKITYPEGYEIYDSQSSESFHQEFGFIENADGSKSRATRVLEGNRKQLYFEGPERYAEYEVLAPDNSVKTLRYRTLGMDILYSAKFKNPFDYFLADDIKEDLSIDGEKATFLLSTLTGKDRSVTKAQFVTDGEEIVGIDFDLPTKTMGLSTTSGFLNVLSDVEVEMTIDLTTPQFSHLTPSTHTNEELANAILSIGDNYTAFFRSNGLANESALYVTKEGVYYQQNRYDKGPRNGDVFYLAQNGIFRTYNVVNGELVRGGMSSVSPVAQYLGGLLNISPALFLDKGEDVYSLVEEATSFGASSLIPTIYGASDGAGLFASVTLKDGKVDEVTSLIEESSVVTFVTELSDYGTTLLPAFVDIDNL